MSITATATGPESASPFPFTVTLEFASCETVSVRATASQGAAGGGPGGQAPATAGADFTATQQVLTFPPGTTQRTFEVPVIDDAAVEPEEFFRVDLDQLVNARAGSPTTAFGIIQDNDASGGGGGGAQVTTTTTTTPPGSTAPGQRIADVTPHPAVAGADVTVTTPSLFAPGTSVQVTLRRARNRLADPVGTATSGSNGSVTFGFALPNPLPPGAYFVRLTGMNPAGQTITVTGLVVVVPSGSANAGGSAFGGPVGPASRGTDSGPTAAAPVWSPLADIDADGRTVGLLAVAALAGGWAIRARRRSELASLARPTTTTGQRGRRLGLASLVAVLTVTGAGLVPATAQQAPAVARDVSQFACPSNEVPPSGFTDTSGNTFQREIDCLAWYEITAGGAGGRPATQYAPTLAVDRAQMATFIARTLDHIDPALLPAYNGQNQFRDVPNNSTHVANINRLAAAGIAQGGTGGAGNDVYGPNNPVQRDQMASFIARAIGRLFDADPCHPVGNFFTDDNNSVHRSCIDILAEMGIVQGAGGGQYNPLSSVNRGQMSAFIMRAMDMLVEELMARTPQ